MPNWCRNTLFITGPEDEAHKLRQLMTSQKSKFDFQSILPMPEEIRTAAVSEDAEAAWDLKYGVWAKTESYYGPSEFDSYEKALKAARANIPRFDHYADHAQKCLERYGHRDWCSWTSDIWGTNGTCRSAGWMSRARAEKRGAVNVVYFDTAWAPPLPVVIALSARFPSLTLRLTYSESQICFKGFSTCRAGEEIDSWYEEYDGEPELFEFGSLDHNLRGLTDNFVYIGAGRALDSRGPRLPGSKWANPFSTLDCTDKEKVELYRRWLLGDMDVASKLGMRGCRPPSIKNIGHHLMGRDLVCDCTAKPCHGLILLNFLTGNFDELEYTDDDERDDSDD
jgi:hypothetical protein